jgi:hypothetical protein
MNEEKKCQYILTDGSRCQAWALKGKTLCFSHSPETKEAKLLAVRKGGQSKEIEIKSPLEKIKVDTPRDVIYLVSKIIEEVRSGQIDVRVASGLGYLSGVLLKAFEVSHSADGVWQPPERSSMDAPREAAEAINQMEEEDRLVMIKILEKYGKPPEDS